MHQRDITRRGFKFGLALAVAMAMGACARNAAEDGAGAGAGSRLGGAATPGSAQDFAVNVGDRVFFDSDSSELNAQGIATLDKQAQWLNQYTRYSFTVAGIQFRARRPARRNGQELPDRQGRLVVPHADDLLRQGASRRRLQRHQLLVAEPALGHRARRRADELTKSAPPPYASAGMPPAQQVHGAGRDVLLPEGSAPGAERRSRRMTGPAGSGGVAPHGPRTGTGRRSSRQGRRPFSFGSPAEQRIERRDRGDRGQRDDRVGEAAERPLGGDVEQPRAGEHRQTVRKA
jgi:hypothetical protein